MGRVMQSQGRSYFCSVSFPRHLKQLLLGAFWIKFTSNVFSLLAIVTCIAMFGMLSLEIQILTEMESLLFDPPVILPPASTLGPVRAVDHYH